jgi:hypothetical protein
VTKVDPDTTVVTVVGTNSVVKNPVEVSVMKSVGQLSVLVIFDIIVEPAETMVIVDVFVPGTWHP